MLGYPATTPTAAVVELDQQSSSQSSEICELGVGSMAGENGADSGGGGSSSPGAMKAFSYPATTAIDTGIAAGMGIRKRAASKDGDRKEGNTVDTTPTRSRNRQGAGEQQAPMVIFL
jgi:hypothetical protein